MLIASVKMQILYRVVFDGLLLYAVLYLWTVLSTRSFWSSLVTGTDILGNSSEFVSLVGKKYTTTKTNLHVESSAPTD